MNDFLFFEITYKLSEILKIVSTKNQGGVFPYSTVISALLGVSVGFFMNFFKEKYTERKKRKKYLECIRWEVLQCQDIAKHLFTFTLHSYTDFKKGNDSIIRSGDTFPVHCFDKFYPEVISILESDKREALCMMQANIPFIEDFNKDIHLPFTEYQRLETPILCEKLFTIMVRSARIYQACRLYLGEISYDEMTNSNVKTIALHFGLDTSYIR
ncbi:hypothetical protein Q0L23_00010 [Klebsiella michiganensis]|uniref:hypothetical protein n=1 Tax=Klebsiella michiganensis TaxID=1134687 RepID=UPI002570B570|nr:hypothetical protein [Klebsiella michiganensis]WJD77954.1 hypothetical protein QRD21_12860 [Klebsiella michiganensis]WKK00162.1 hypothetical protein Q0L46_11385 [Klebsiella michiganensis]WKK03882.1 hypothetical protein Q0L23_00010 [Klebsiella michiganensis]